MKNHFCYSLVLFLLFFSSCTNGISRKGTFNLDSTTKFVNTAEPNFTYEIKAPNGWLLYDTIFQGLKVRFIQAPESLSAYNPLVNVIIVSMGSKRLDNFTTSNMKELQNNMEGVVLKERGMIDISGIKASWFTYSTTNVEPVRDAITYIVPVHGYAHIFTCATNAGSMTLFRETFDQITQSFTANQPSFDPYNRN